MKTVLLIPLVLIIFIFSAASALSFHQDLEISQDEIAHYGAKLAVANQQLDSANAKRAELWFTIDKLERKLEVEDDIAADLEARNQRLGKLNDDLQSKSNLRDFKSTDELEEFLSNSPVDYTIYATGKLDFLTYDCEDYAIALRDDAYSKGFHMNIQAVWNYRRPDTGELITEYNEGHALNSIIIGNEMYFIEPQTDEYWLATYLD